MSAITRPDAVRLPAASLPESMHDIIGVLGYNAALRLVRRYGGATLSGRATAPYGKHNDPHPLEDALSFEEITSLTKWTCCTPLYIPRCDAAIRVIRDASFMDEYHRLTDEGCSGRMAIACLCPHYGFSDRTGWKIIRRWRDNNPHSGGPRT